MFLTIGAPQIIEKNTRIRLKIVGTRVDATEIVSHFVTITWTIPQVSDSLRLGQ
jgi:hypothetical protein